MLDFYLLADNQNMPNYPEEGGHKLVGNIDAQIFDRLKLKKIIPERFDYHSDFRWDTSLIQQIRMNIQKHTVRDSDIQSLLLLLDTAKSYDSGLVAYAD